jgi:hypothetical protein
MARRREQVMSMQRTQCGRLDKMPPFHVRSFIVVGILDIGGG